MCILWFQEFWEEQHLTLELKTLSNKTFNLKYMSKTTVVSLGEIAGPEFNLVLEKNEKIN